MSIDRDRSRADGGTDAPPVALLTHPARAGGTLISRCLGCMEGVFLLSEISPASLVYHQAFNPYQQAVQWHGLLTLEEARVTVDALNARNATIDEMVAEILLDLDRRATARGGRLVVRDWAHGDFWGTTWLPEPREPTGHASTRDALAPHRPLAQVLTVRHPVASWLSYMRYQTAERHLNPLRAADYLAGLRRFATAHADLTPMPYEHLLVDPEAFMAAVCARLAVPYDPRFPDRWAAYRLVSGDRLDDRPTTRIGPLPEPDAAFRSAALALRDNPDLLWVLDRWGYNLERLAPEADLPT